MIIKSVRLQNIRSYKDAVVELPQGRTLFEGDIGSGKSTLLMAMEFALFGLGSETGGSLLRSGEQRGSVSLVFEVDGTEYTVQRNLARKSGKVQQTDGELITPNGIENLSPRDMKERMLKLLEFKEPLNPKAQSVIYRYAVYTPQERMKEILSMEPDLRLQTLRKAFGIEDYKIAKENALLLDANIQNRVRGFETVISTPPSLPVLAGRVLQGQINLESKRHEVVTATVAKDKKEKLRKSLIEDMEVLKEDEQALRMATQKCSLLERFFRSNSGELTLLAEQVRGCERRLSRLQAQFNDLEKVEDPTPKSEDQLKEDIRALEVHVRDLLRLKGRIETKIDEYKSIRETGSCPTCDREADPAEFVEKERLKVAENERYSHTIERHELEVEETRRLLERKHDYNSTREDLAECRLNLTEAETELKEKRDLERRMKGEHEELEEKLFKARKEIELLSGVSEKIEKLESQIASVDEDIRNIRSTLDRADAEIRHFEQSIRDDQEQLSAKEEAKRKALTLRDHGVWLENYLVPSLDAIEKQVLLSINQDFNSHFRGWFSTLVEDQSKEARVDENFTPLVEQDGYEQEVDYLSGGERTSLALAYRLALNGIVRRVSGGMKSNLLILDEPTDGFSNEQLAKMREILDEIDSPQVIIVSHDKELESLADQIYRVAKEHGESKVTLGN